MKICEISSSSKWNKADGSNSTIVDVRDGLWLDSYYRILYIYSIDNYSIYRYNIQIGSYMKKWSEHFTLLWNCNENNIQHCINIYYLYSLVFAN